MFLSLGVFEPCASFRESVSTRRGWCLFRLDVMSLVVLLMVLSSSAQADLNFKQLPISSTFEPVSLVTADLDGDGDLDVVSASVRDGIYWYRNEEGKAFSRMLVVDDYRSWSVDVADLDGDGHVDIVSGTTLRGPKWYRNDGSGGFIEMPRINPEVGLEDSLSVAVADMDNDGDLDVVYAVGSSVADTYPKNDEMVMWSRNHGDGTFAPGTTIAQSIQARSIHLADLNNDGDIDILATGIETLRWYRNDGFGRFVFGSTIRSVRRNTFSRPTLWTTTAGDLDGDGATDVVSAADSEGGNLVWYSNDGEGNFQKRSQIGLFARSLQLADLDGDGQLDVVANVYDDLVWYRNEAGSFAPRKDIGLSLGARLWYVHTADMDNDDALDVLTAVNGDDSAIFWFRQESSEKSQVPKGTIVGVVFGSLAAVALAVWGVLVLIRFKRKDTIGLEGEQIIPETAVSTSYVELQESSDTMNETTTVSASHIELQDSPIFSESSDTMDEEELPTYIEVMGCGEPFNAKA